MTAHIAEGNKTKEKVKQIKKKREREGFKRNIFFFLKTSRLLPFVFIDPYLYMFIYLYIRKEDKEWGKRGMKK